MGCIRGTESHFQQQYIETIGCIDSGRKTLLLTELITSGYMGYPLLWLGVELQSLQIHFCMYVLHIALLYLNNK